MMLRPFLIILWTWALLDKTGSSVAAAAAALNNVYTDCGGIVRITAIDNPSIEYKHGQSYGPNERCVWTILPEPGLVIESLIILVENQNFSPGDGLTVYTWPENNGDLVARKIQDNETGIAIPLPTTNHAFLYFSSGTGGGGSSGLGFKVDIIGVEGESQQGRKHDAQFLNGISCNRKFYYPKFPAHIYDDNVRMSIVLQHSDPSITTRLDIGYLALETNVDILRIFDLLPYSEEDQFILEGTHTGTHLGGIDGTDSNEPRLLLFSTDSSGGRRGFYFNWY